MNNELFELCKEVYEKTGWKYGEPYLKYNVFSMYKESDILYYLYTSDYILEKLQHTYYITIENHGFGKNLYWYVYPYGNDNEKIEKPTGKADTPLKALLKLTLALHEAGELK